MKEFNQALWDERQETIMIVASVGLWLLHLIMSAVYSEFGQSEIGRNSGRFIETIVFMIFTFKFTKSRPSEKSGGNGEVDADQ